MDGVVALGGHPWAGLRNAPDWSLEAQREYWNREWAACPDETGRTFISLQREEVDQELGRRARLSYRHAEAPCNLDPVIAAVKQRASVLDVFATRAVAAPFYGDSLSRSLHKRVVMFLCPFHPEKTPSCAVYRESGRWKCFGCQNSGDVIAAVMKLDGLEFVEAVLSLAREYGVDVPRREPPKKRLRLVENW
jgi:hypothetical protein